MPFSALNLVLGPSSTREYQISDWIVKENCRLETCRDRLVFWAASPIHGTNLTRVQARTRWDACKRLVRQIRVRPSPQFWFEISIFLQVIFNTFSAARCNISSLLTQKQNSPICFLFSFFHWHSTWTNVFNELWKKWKKCHEKFFLII